MLEKKIRNSLEHKYSNYNYRDLYMKFRKSQGMVKSVCAEYMIDCFIEEPRFIMEDDIEDFLNTIEMDSVWLLARESKNLTLRDVCREKAISVLITDANRPVFEEKVELDRQEEEKEMQMVLRKSMK